jgi:putative ubiquitin-RnfH superfamily antitoxin RatB of RatAB toxin-antitoxin module
MSAGTQIEVVYALPRREVLLKLEVPPGATVADAIRLSGILQTCPDIDLDRNRFGIYGKLAEAGTILRDRDRIEIYRPLRADPKEVRRRRAGEGKAMKKGGGGSAA